MVTLELNIVTEDDKVLLRAIHDIVAVERTEHGCSAIAPNGKGYTIGWTNNPGKPYYVEDSELDKMYELLKTAIYDIHKRRSDNNWILVNLVAKPRPILTEEPHSGCKFTVG